MQVTKHPEHQDADNQRSETQLEFTFTDKEKENIDTLFEIMGEPQYVVYTAICNDEDAYTLVIDKNYDASEYTK